MKNNQLTVSIALLFYSVFTVHAEQTISLNQAIKLAQQNDPWLQGSRLKQQAVEHRSVAAATLPNPSVSVSMMNLPTDTLNVNQEAMTQFKLGVSQMFPRGDSLAIAQSQLQTDATKFPLLRENRKAKVKQTVTELWLDAYLAQQTISLIERDQALFEQMAEVAEASYANAIGETRQQDVIRAQLELIQLEDRLTVQKQKQEVALARLNEWLLVHDVALDKPFDFDSKFSAFGVTDALPNLKPKGEMNWSSYSRNDVANSLLTHPAVEAVSVKQQVSKKSIELAKQQYKSQWGVNASYGYRADTPMDTSRADLFSVGVTFDLPLFTSNKQDQLVAASTAEFEAVKTEKLLLVKQMLVAIEKELRQLNRLAQRQTLYQEKLLKQTHDQAEASLTAYTNDDGDFAEVVRARIAELNTRIAALNIEVDVMKTTARLNYFLTQSEYKTSLSIASVVGGE